MQLITGRFLLTEACSAPIEVSTLYQRWSIFNAPEKFSLGGVTGILCNELHWLSVPQRVKFKLGTMIVSLPASLFSAVPVRLLHAGRSRMSPLAVNYGPPDVI